MREHEPRNRKAPGRVVGFRPAAGAAHGDPAPTAAVTGRPVQRGIHRWSRRDVLIQGLVATRATACPGCGARASELEWHHVSLGTGEYAGVGWSGWTSFCRRCDRQVDGFEDSFLIA